MTPETILSNIDITVTVIHPHDPERPAGVVGEYQFPTLWMITKPDHTADNPQRDVATLHGLSIADALEVISPTLVERVRMFF
jgi:hypothetical protein